MRTLHLVAALLTLPLLIPVANAGSSIEPDSPKQPKLMTPEPNSALEHNNRGVELGTLGRWKEAIKEHDLALLEDPKNKCFRTNLSCAHLRYGDLLIKKDDMLPAVAEFHAALFVDPANFEAANKLKALEEPSGVNSGPGHATIPKRTMPTPEELDQFLHGTGETLHGYDEGY
jgi:hypothetical protein